MGERLTTAQAEKRTGASRWALMRAHKSGVLPGERDNRGRWMWDADALDRWNEGRDTERTPAVPQEPAELPRLRAELLEARERAARAEGERDGLREALSEARSRAATAEQRAATAEEAARQVQGWRWPWQRART